MRVGPFGIWEILIVLVVILIIFGPSRLPKLARGLGQSVREFRSGIKEFQRDLEQETTEVSTTAPASKDGSTS